MFYDVYEWQRVWTAPLRGGLEAAAQAAVPWCDQTVHHLNLARRLADAGEPVTEDLRDFVREQVQRPLDAEVLRLGPFARLWRFRVDGQHAAPAVLVPPHSGFVAGVTAPLIASILQARPVYVLDWVDARLVPRTDGQFTLKAQAEAIAEALRIAGDGVVAIGLSQSVTALLIAISGLSREGWRPAVAVLMAGPVDARRSPTPMTTYLQMQPETWLEQQATTVVPRRYPGAGRRVYPGLLPLMAYAAFTPHLYGETLIRYVSEGLSGTAGPSSRDHRDLHCLMDVPAELFLDSVRAAFREHIVATGRAGLPQGPVDLNQLRGLNLVTIEAGQDELIGPGQTHAAHKLIPDVRGHAWTVPGVSHHQMFSGPRFARAVGGQLCEYLQAA